MPDLHAVPVPARTLFGRVPRAEASRVADILRKETVGGALLLLAAGIAIIWANSPAVGSYEALRDYRIGPESVHLNLSLGTWAADGLLAIFFFVVGLELKREFVAGDLRDPRRAAVPIFAAIAGVAVPALVYVAINLTAGDGALRGWAIPTATDIAFAVAILAMISTHLPIALRTFLLTLAVVDDLFAVAIIAIFYTGELHSGYLLAALVPIGLFAIAVQRQIRRWWLLLPLAFVAWAFVHASGVHATVAGVLLGFTVPVILGPAPEGERSGVGLAEHFEHRIRPISAGVAVPVFAFFAAGVTIGGFAGLFESLTDRVAVGVVAGLVLGKPLGILAMTWAVARFTRASLDPSLRWLDILGVSMLAGIGFTVSLLIGDLAFGAGSTQDEHVKVAVLTASLVASILAGVTLKSRDRHYRRIEEADGDEAEQSLAPPRQ